MSGRDLLCVRLYELAVHTWDLARSLGLDDTLDEAILDAAEQGRLVLDPLALRPDVQFFEDVPPVGAELSAQDRLLALSGRKV